MRVWTNRSSLPAALFAFLALWTPVRADTLLLKNGDRVHGRFVSVDERGYLIDMNGTTRRIPLADVAKLMIDPSTPAREEPGRRGALWMNFVFPGWGQMADGRTGTGLAIGGLFVTTATGAAIVGFESRRLYREYRNRSRDAAFFALVAPSPGHLGVMVYSYADIRDRRLGVERAQRTALALLGISALTYGAGIAEFQLHGASAAFLIGPGSFRVVFSM